MASSYARLMICTMDPMLDSKMHENGNLLELDGHRAVEKQQLERASSLPSLTPLPRDWVKALPRILLLHPVADARSANAPALLLILRLHQLQHQPSHLAGVAQVCCSQLLLQTATALQAAAW